MCVARIGIEAKVKVEGKKGRKKKAKVKVEGKKGRKKKSQSSSSKHRNKWAGRVAGRGQSTAREKANLSPLRKVL